MSEKELNRKKNPSLSVSASELLGVWEQLRSRPITLKALKILELLFPDQPASSVASLPIGDRDAGLLWIRSQLFGNRLSCVVNCPTCAELLEFNIEISNLLQSTSPLSFDFEQRRYQWEGEGYNIDYRLPNSVDVESALKLPLKAQSAALLQACIVDVQKNGQKSDFSLPPHIKKMFSDALANRDPLADIRLNISCVNCGTEWDAQFDIVTYFWNDLDRWATKTLQQVHLLARAYGWNENEILSLSAWRRAHYIEMAYG